MKTNAEKLSISLPFPMVEFVKEYQLAHAYKSKSEVFQDALKLLRKKELESEYAQANLEIDSDFDVLSADGLDDETW
jgi:antitoxin ParD1/3/4